MRSRRGGDQVRAGRGAREEERAPPNTAIGARTPTNFTAEANTFANAKRSARQEERGEREDEHQHRRPGPDHRQIIARGSQHCRKIVGVGGGGADPRGERPDRLEDVVVGQVRLLEQREGVARAQVLVRRAEDAHRDERVGLGDQVRDRGAEAARRRALLGRHEEAGLARGAEDRRIVQGLHRVHVQDADLEALVAR